MRYVAIALMVLTVAGCSGKPNKKDLEEAILARETRTCQEQLVYLGSSAPNSPSVDTGALAYQKFSALAAKWQKHKFVEEPAEGLRFMRFSLPETEGRTEDGFNFVLMLSGHYSNPTVREARASGCTLVTTAVKIHDISIDQGDPKKVTALYTRTRSLTSFGRDVVDLDLRGFIGYAENGVTPTPTQELKATLRRLDDTGWRAEEISFTGQTFEPE